MTETKMKSKDWNVISYENSTRLQMKFHEQKGKVKIKIICSRNDKDKSEKRTLGYSLLREEHTSSNEIQETKVNSKT